MADPIGEQIEYYRARAGEYDEWFFRKGRYDHGHESNRRWFGEVEEVRGALRAFAPTGQVLELAGGTGLWTEQLVQYADEVTVVDSSPEVLSINRGRVGSDRVQYVEADLFSWRPRERYDVVFFGFWLSHVPDDRFVAFWELVRSCLRPHGRVFFVDSLRAETSTAIDHDLGDPKTVQQIRRLNDGREYTVVKIFHEPTELQERLRELGWEIVVGATANYFLYGSGKEG